MDTFFGWASANIENASDELDAGKEVCCWFHVLPFITKAVVEHDADPVVNEAGEVCEVTIFFEGKSDRANGDIADEIEAELSWKGATFGDVSVHTIDRGAV